MAKPRILVCYSEFDKAFGSKLVDDLTLAGAQTSILAGDALQQIQGYERNAQQILTDGQCEWFIQVWTWKAVNSAPVLDTFRTACDLYMVGRIEGLIVMAADDVVLGKYLMFALMVASAATLTHRLITLLPLIVPLKQSDYLP